MDLISRQAAIDSFRYDDDGTAWNMDDIVYRLEQFPSVQPERKKGKWLDNETSFADGARQTCTCSICGRRSTRPIGGFCRWCGADMRGEQDE